MTCTSSTYKLRFKKFETGNNFPSCFFPLPDDQMPSVQCPNDVIKVTYAASDIVEWEPATATDNLAQPSEITLSYSMNSGTIFYSNVDPLPRTVTVTATDTFGNKGICKFNVTLIRPPSELSLTHHYRYTLMPNWPSPRNTRLWRLSPQYTSQHWYSYAQLALTTKYHRRLWRLSPQYTSQHWYTLMPNLLSPQNTTGECSDRIPDIRIIYF